MLEIENESIRFWKEDGILFNEFKKPTDLTLEIVEQIIDLRHQISNGEMQYWCTSFSNVNSMPKEGRDYTDLHGQEFLHASAALVDSPITKFIVNVFTMIKKPKVPFRAFTKKEEAINWLNEMKVQNEGK